MSCCPSCGCNYTVNLTNGDPSALLFQNQNTIGVGMFDNESNLTVGFRGVASASAALTIGLDGTNKAALFTLDIAAITAAIPQATTAVAGKGETATDAEALAKASILTFVTPSNFAAMGSTTTFAGLVELATNAEALAGASTTLAITPDDLKYVLDRTTLPVIVADAVQRAAAAPNFTGALLAQADTKIIWVGQSLVAGDWKPLLELGITNVHPNATTSLNITGADTFAISLSNANAIFSTTGIGQFQMDSAMDFTGSQPFTFTSLPVPDSLLGADAGSLPAFYAISSFISAQNSQTGYTAFTNPATIRTCNTATVTLQQLAQLIGTLIEDLKAVKLPAT